MQLCFGSTRFQQHHWCGAGPLDQVLRRRQRPVVIDGGNILWMTSASLIFNHARKMKSLIDSDVLAESFCVLFSDKRLCCWMTPCAIRRLPRNRLTTSLYQIAQPRRCLLRAHLSARCTYRLCSSTPRSHFVSAREKTWLADEFYLISFFTLSVHRRTLAEVTMPWFAPLATREELYRRLQFRDSSLPLTCVDPLCGGCCCLCLFRP